MPDAHGFNRWGLPANFGLARRVKLKALFMTVWCPDSRSVESNCGIPRG